MKNFTLIALTQISCKSGDSCTVKLISNRNLPVSKTSSDVRDLKLKTNVKLLLIKEN